MIPLNLTKEERMATGSVFSLVISMSISSIIAQLINALYNIVDRIYIGHIPGVGAAALTGVGLTFPVVVLISVFSVSAEHISETKATLKFQQYDPSVTSELSFGEPFVIQKKDGENWKEADIIVEGEYGFHDVAYAYFLLR